MNPSSPIRWAISEAEAKHRLLCEVHGVEVLADFEGKLAKAHLAADRAEEIEQEHFALKMALRGMLKLYADHFKTSFSGDYSPADMEPFRLASQIVANLSKP